MTFRVELGHLPDSRLSPNARLNRYVLANIKRGAKEQAWILCKAQGVPTEPYAKAHITITYVGDNRRRDFDNLLSASKHYLDGIVAAGVIKDDNVFVVSYSLHYEVGKPNTIIEIEEQ